MFKFLILFSTLISLSLPLRATEKTSCASALFVHVERFYGVDPMFRRTLRTRLEMSASDETLTPKTCVITLEESRPPNRLENHDQFVLGIMERRKVLSSSQVSHHSAISHSIDFRQITNIETIHDETTINEQDQARISGYVQILNENLDQDKLLFSMRDATMRITSGQFLENGKIVRKSLPWVLEFPKEKKAIKRIKGKWLWEIGRTGQLSKGKTIIASFVASTLILRELQALGGNIDDGIVMIHAPRKANAALFKGKHSPYRFYHFLTPADSPDEEILFLPLKEFVDQFSPQKVFPILKDFSFKEIDHAVNMRRISYLAMHPKTTDSINIRLRDFSNSFDKVTSVPTEHLKDILGRDFSSGEEKFYMPPELEQPLENPIGFVEISGLEKVLQNSNPKVMLALALLSALKVYRNQLKVNGIKDTRNKIKKILFISYGLDSVPFESLLKELGLNSLEFSTVNGKDRPALLLKGQELLELEASNTRLIKKILIQKLNDYRKRVFFNPMNF